MSTFSFTDRFRLILNSCLPACLSTSTHHPSSSSFIYFSDSVQEPLLLNNHHHPSDLISLHSNLHQFNQELFNPSSKPLSTLQSISSCISSHLCFKTQLHSDSDLVYQPQSHNRRPSESDARVLGDLSFLVSPQNPNSNQLQPVYPQTTISATIPTDDQLRQEEEALAVIEEQEYRLARKRAKKKAKALGLLQRSNSSQCSSSQASSQLSTSRSSKSDPSNHKSKTQSRLRPHSPNTRSSRSSRSSDFSDCDILSNPTITSTNTDASVPITLTPEIIESIRNTFGADAEELYGQELTLIQIEQIYHHLESKRNLSQSGQLQSLGSEKKSRSSKSNRVRPTSSSNEDHHINRQDTK